MKVVVLAGGLSDERDVSLSSASQISNALIQNGHHVLLMDAFFGFKGVKNFDEAYAKFGKKEYTAKISHIAPDLAALQAANPELTNLVGPNLIEICQSADVVFMGLHGGIGENGQIQALFDLYHIPYTGSGYKASAVAMDKLLSKKLVMAEGVTSPDFWVYDGLQEIFALAEEITYPVVVKPLDNGSSIGIQMVDNEAQLEAALLDARKYSAQVLLEKKVVGREFSVGLLDGQAVPIIEIIPLKGFYDYANKYQAGATKEVTPAELPEDVTKKMQAAAEKSYQILGLHGYSRVDFMIDADGTIQFIEANTLPGMTPTSLLPQEVAAMGMSYPELCQKLLQSAFNR